MVSRADRSTFSEWWWTVDRWLLIAICALMFGGVVLSLAGSPAVAERLNLDSFHFVKRHVFFFVPSVAVLIAASFLTPRQVRRMSLVLFAVTIAMMLATLVVGQEIKGSRRWLSIAELSIQPSEFMKPAFIVLAAWLSPRIPSARTSPATSFRRCCWAWSASCSSPSPISARPC
jgi:cell division protein FtsW